MARGKPWTDDDDAQVRRLVPTGITDTAIARAMGRNPSLVSAKRKALGLEAGWTPRLGAMLAPINHRRLLASGQ